MRCGTVTKLRFTVIHQIFFSGHVKKGANKAAVAADAEMACGLSEIHNVTGLTLFSDGTFITVIEGKEQDTMAVFETIKADKRFAQMQVIVSSSRSTEEFKDYKIGFRDNDFSDSVPQSFRITAKSFKDALPPNPSAEFKILIRTFLRVNNFLLDREAA